MRWGGCEGRALSRDGGPLVVTLSIAQRFRGPGLQPWSSMVTSSNQRRTSEIHPDHVIRGSFCQVGGWFGVPARSGRTNKPLVGGFGHGPAMSTPSARVSQDLRQAIPPLAVWQDDHCSGLRPRSILLLGQGEEVNAVARGAVTLRRGRRTTSDDRKSTCRENRRARMSQASRARCFQAPRSRLALRLVA